MKFLFVPPGLVVVLSGITAALHVGKLPPALPILREALDITLLQAGFLVSLVQLAGMSLGLLVGLSADSLGLKRSMTFGLGILLAASALGGLAQTPAFLLACRGLEGLGFLLVVLPAPALLRQLVPIERLNRALALWSCYMGLGIGSALLLGPWMIDWLGWQGWWWVLAGWTAIMLAWLGHRVPADHRRHGALTLSAGAEEGWRQRLALTLGTPGPWLVAVCFAMYSSQWLAVIGFLPTIYQQAGLGGLLAGSLTTLVAAINIVGNLGSGQLMHRGVAPAHLLYLGFTFTALGTFLAFGELTAQAPMLRFAAILMFSAVGGVIPGALFMLAVKLAPSERTVSTTIGWMQQWSALGQFAGPPLVAWLASQVGGWHWTWSVTAGCSLMGIVLAWRLGQARHDYPAQSAGVVAR
ncbi:CynX/NimT family MFS transporter [Halomonas korlensis]|uniref:Cyanate permease n=1 Tax=Halomonas korlensis TaxID=463301 RepID=A0A1I7J943_9GAMM|nr:MFS transporter [Halomonas korlensis]SFU81654.1 Cyanate permease [Halomonas korlensis]